ncbi:hypothetical protein CFSAN002368_08010 [Clostridium botulinum A1 str. CFSAN002368]|nr:hypothetical protein CFSAN002368_08010 [Clostridium botulinum A1 str. CFSAN002368]
MPYVESIRELKANTMDDEYYIRFIKRIKFLIIDDLL